jgi:hypothetical protein
MELQYHPDPAARKLSTNLYDIYHCCVYIDEDCMCMHTCEIMTLAGIIRGSFVKFVRPNRFKEQKDWFQLISSYY